MNGYILRAGTQAEVVGLPRPLDHRGGRLLPLADRPGPAAAPEELPVQTPQPLLRRSRVQPLGPRGRQSPPISPIAPRAVPPPPHQRVAFPPQHALVRQGKPLLTPLLTSPLTSLLSSRFMCMVCANFPLRSKVFFFFDYLNWHATSPRPAEVVLHQDLGEHREELLETQERGHRRRRRRGGRRATPQAEVTTSQKL